MKTTFQILLTGSLVFASILFFASGCGSDDDLFTVQCPPFAEEQFEWFPYEQGNVLKFTSTDSAALERDIVIRSTVAFGDTSYQTLFADETCTPFAEYLGGEEAADVTVLNYRILDLSSGDGGVIIIVNISDFNIIGAYTQQVLIPETGDRAPGLNSELTEVGDQMINGVLYEDILRLDLINIPDFPDQYFNDVRSIWIAKGGGIVRFRDNLLGTFELEP